MIEQRSTGSGARDPIAACSRLSPAIFVRPAGVVRSSSHSSITFVADAGRHDARKQRDRGFFLTESALRRHS